PLLLRFVLPYVLVRRKRKARQEHPRNRTRALVVSRPHYLGRVAHRNRRARRRWGEVHPWFSLFLRIPYSAQQLGRSMSGSAPLCLLCDVRYQGVGYNRRNGIVLA